MDTENKKISEDMVDEKKDVEKTELLIALPALIDNIRTELKLSEEQLFSLNGELTISILEDEKVENLAEKIEDLFLGSLDESIIDKVVQKVLVFFDSKEEILAPEKNNNYGDPKKDDTNRDILTRLNQSFSAPTTLAPVKRDYSVARTEPTGTTPVVGIPEKKIDPYREMPEV